MSHPAIANAASPPPAVARLGLGCVTFGREIDEAAAFAMLDWAWSRGIRMFDTAAAYGAGASERIVGAWFASRRPADDAVVATKILPPYTPERIESAVRESTARLSPAPIGLLYLHRWDESAAMPETLDCLDRLARAGAFRALGISNIDAACLQRVVELQRAAGRVPVRVVQNNHNVAVRGVDAALRDVCRTHDISIVTYSPLGAGFLTGKYRTGVADGTRFAVIPGHQKIYFTAEALDRLDRLEALAARSGHPQTQLALAWAVHEPDVDVVLVGGRSPAQLEQAVAAQAFKEWTLLRELDA